MPPDDAPDVDNDEAAELVGEPELDAVGAVVPEAEVVKVVLEPELDFEAVDPVPEAEGEDEVDDGL